MALFKFSKYRIANSNMFQAAMQLAA